MSHWEKRTDRPHGIITTVGVCLGISARMKRDDSGCRFSSWKDEAKGGRMTPQTLKALKAILDADPTVADVHKKLLIRVCRNPEVESTQSRPQGKMRFLTAREVAEMLSVTQRTVWRLVERGQLTPAKISRRFTRFRAEEIESLVP
jgi:excisionase family DNA binding protein